MPIIYLGAAIGIAIGMLLFVFPNITGLFASFEDAELPGITKFFLDVGDFTAENALPIFGILTIVFLAFYGFNKYSKDAHHLFTVITLNMPIVGKLMQMHNQIMIANALSQMLSNGINPLQALKTIYSFLSNSVYKRIIEQTINYIEDGQTLAKAFEESNYIDPIMAKMISTGEQTSDVPNLMNNLAKYYNGISDLRVEQLKNAIQPILLILVYSIVGVMILAIMLPMIALGGQI
jgi:type IV pilus assembly protein PilC